MTEATGSDMLLIGVSVITLVGIAFVVSLFVGSISQVDRQDYPAVLSVDKFKIENCLKLNDNLILDFNKFNNETLKNCVESGVNIKVKDLDNNLIKEFNSENELSRRFPLCSVEKSRYKCREFFGRYVVENNGLKEYKLEINLVTENV